MSELVMKMFGLSGFVKGGQAMAERLNKSGVKNIKVVGRGAVIVDGSADPEKINRLRKAARKFIEQDAEAVAAAKANTKDSDD
ncbi:hypothetical protein UYSO10_4991 [Kosakonia radicincitans]|uniref:hypothetical protein n=1 Tax=Kosakonia radicincitans TaxID=283686 RepID=UPI00118440FD|nr:hypothetical protein [Kosakonia radicincitans]VVT53996.1 hypothetical protein UYSO10_4991 [Kosakonia radicincitans]